MSSFSLEPKMQFLNEVVPISWSLLYPSSYWFLLVLHHFLQELCYILLKLSEWFKIKKLFSAVQLLSCVRLFATPWISARQDSLSITNSQSSLKLTSINARHTVGPQERFQWWRWDLSVSLVCFKILLHCLLLWKIEKITPTFHGSDGVCKCPNALLAWPIVITH